MRKIKEVLRLRFELGLGQRAIARACSISQSTVHEYLKRAEAAKVPWPLPEGWDQERVEKVLFGEPRPSGQFPERVRPDFPALHAQLQQQSLLGSRSRHCYAIKMGTSLRLDGVIAGVMHSPPCDSRCTEAQR
jgi:hypothetical protein